MRIDLHLHTTASDGSLSPSALVWAARAGGLHIIAVTDHDTAAGVPEAQRAGAEIVHVIPGIEVSTTHEGTEQHLLGYFIDPASDSLLTYSRTALARRRERMDGMLDRLARLGISVDVEAVAAVAGPARLLARPHLARVLVQSGHAGSFAEAFDRFIGDEAPAYLPVDLLNPESAIALIHAVGGVAVWAHPRPDVAQKEIARFVDWGLDGIECFRPRCTADDCMRLEKMAARHGLVVTGGSDWHGVWHGRLGEFSVAPEEVGRFLDLGGI